MKTRSDAGDTGFVARRMVAIQILSKFYESLASRQAHLDTLFSDPAIALSDRQWLFETVSGTLRYQGRIEWILEQFGSKKKPSGFLLRALSTAVYSILAQDQVAHEKVIFETVELIKQKLGKPPSGFANSILRKILLHREAYRNLPVPAQDQARWASMPVWMYERIRKDHGEAFAARFARSTLERPRVWIRTRTGEAKLLPPDAGEIPELPGFFQGEFFVQDLASQKCLERVEEMLETRFQDKKWIQALDLCSAPGGKAMGLALLPYFTKHERGVKVFAHDSNPTRLRLVSENVQRMKLEKQIVVLESVPVSGQDPIFSEGLDLVWVDAPCTGSGIVRRHPEIKWAKKEKDLKELGEIQLGLLTQAARLLEGSHRSPRLLVYSVCSVFKEEGELRVKDWLRLNPDWTSIHSELLLETQTDRPSDGFYLAILELQN